ncbi:glycosyltransferase [Desulfovibrio gilichinskyi]|uniref:Glycosyltransferase involved in cell wall bisynthesis n=1 Tax=Desulfovibrio gilichinskyi TaxID=1519643 RepID=A0A1X7EF74_9BACT|nr:glycosyltransferase [Desulfovibrio gilichinskyi]SMF32892.1 Glycosyltransferase involved in cell wall bisynthesis [Desulfovibrio gilichinskyi]
MLARTVIHHTALKKSGGATRVALLILNGLEESGYTTLHSYEASENPLDPLISAEEAAMKIPGNTVVHLHSSADPAKFISALPETVRLIVTLHDSQMITGGCSHPLDCTHFKKKCLNPCPRGFADSEEVRRTSIETLLKREAVLISPSKWLANQAKIADPRLLVKIIPNGIPWPDSIGDKKIAREKLRVPIAAKVVLFIAHGGVNAAYKSGSQWAAYWEGIKKKVPDAIGFAIGGSENSRDGDFITIPYVDRETLGEFMTAANVLAYPTLADNHPLIILEAMSKGLPSVSYAVGGVVEQIVSGTNGILVTPYNKKDLVENISTLLLAPRVSKELGVSAFQTGSKKFSQIRMLKDYKKVYSRLDLN